MGIAGSYGNSVFSFLRNFLLFSGLHQYLLFGLFLMIAIVTGVVIIFFLICFWLCWILVALKGFLQTQRAGVLSAAVYGLLITAAFLLAEHGL